MCQFLGEMTDPTAGAEEMQHETGANTKKRSALKRQSEKIKKENNAFKRTEEPT